MFLWTQLAGASTVDWGCRRGRRRTISLLWTWTIMNVVFCFEAVVQIRLLCICPVVGRGINSVPFCCSAHTFQEPAIFYWIMEFQINHFWIPHRTIIRWAEVIICGGCIIGPNFLICVNHSGSSFLHVPFVQCKFGGFGNRLMNYSPNERWLKYKPGCTRCLCARRLSTLKFGLGLLQLAIECGFLVLVGYNKQIKLVVNNKILLIIQRI